LKLLSVNVGLPRDVLWRGKTVRTSIWKSPVDGDVRVATLNLDGDRQSDLTVHGGADKAVYVYPSEHYPHWRERLRNPGLAFGAFGENFTTEGLLETEVEVGDRLRAGSAEFVVTQPRMPCFKLGIRFDDPHFVKIFLESRRSGFYLRVLREGVVRAGDLIEMIERSRSGLRVTDVVDLYASDSENQDLLRLAAESPALPEDWREYFRGRLWNADG
jgi:MOSC domain-containing protein YiiM